MHYRNACHSVTGLSIHVPLYNVSASHESDSAGSMNLNPAFNVRRSLSLAASCAFLFM